jgi:hypothetical protein
MVMGGAFYSTGDVSDRGPGFWMRVSFAKIPKDLVGRPR